ncbi:DUF1045 domain-containing protein [Ruegeria sp. 2012CJ41-6]|uniref:DUF1045 domain-containing protein n=1 Tax=Ruegeria spongiae TaxID=2942209 RepID=A0ABT0PYE9_9RHOB|nr:DUF1045 domain-containing protein [Ruegeria spongiae]MCL6282372.1 DUF1045 domain-containing protein [Ruegeria spongiae]
MNNHRRYAVFHTPPDGILAEKAAQWLGWDPVSGLAPEFPGLDGLPAPNRKLTARPRKYGFHGTLRPPFRPAQGLTLDRLQDMADDLARSLRPVTLNGLSVAALGPFLALRPVGETGPLTDLAAQIIEATNTWRTPLSAEERARRNPDRLSPQHRALLDQWGYPFVMGAFQFHMTLTGPLRPEERNPLQILLARYFEGCIPHPYPISDLCLMGEGEDGRFRLLSRHPLLG